MASPMGRGSEVIAPWQGDALQKCEVEVVAAHLAAMSQARSATP